MAASTEVRRLRATPSDTKHLHLPRGAAGAMDASSAFESAPTDPTMAVAYESCGPVLQVGEASGAALSAQDMALPGR